jgi:hypothetical protein
MPKIILFFSGEHYLATAAGVAPGGGSDGASNKVLLVLPGGQMILTDLTDEQCGQLNIQVASQDGGDGAVVVGNGPPQVNMNGFSDSSVEEVAVVANESAATHQEHQDSSQQQQPTLIQPITSQPDGDRDEESNNLAPNESPETAVVVGPSDAPAKSMPAVETFDLTDMSPDEEEPANQS